MADKHLEGFVLSDDMIRIEIPDADLRFYVLAYLNSSAGRSLLRRDKTGSVIDHLSEDQVKNQAIVMLEPSIVKAVARLMKKAFLAREEARLGLTEMLKELEATLPSVKRATSLSDGWEISSLDFIGRIDAAYYVPRVTEVAKSLSKIGGKPVGELATVLKPGGRYKTCYVDKDYGRPLLSGGQLLQYYPINLQYMPDIAFKDVEPYVLHKDWIAYPADGRAEEELGTPVLITQSREGWLGSGHIGRVIAKKGVDIGSLLLALRTEHVQLQIKAKASGSVVDSTFEDDLASVVLPPLSLIDGRKVRKYWRLFDVASLAEDEAIEQIDSAS
jgi:hypothetical protein